MRRSAQLRRARHDLAVQSLRGNLQTRLRKLDKGDYDAIVLAEAGPQRMGIDIEYSRLDIERFVPSANQGTIVVVARRGTQGEALSRSLDDGPTRFETMIERKILETVGGGCVVPMAVHAALQGQQVRVLTEVLSLDGSKTVRLDEEISLEGDWLQESADLGRRLMEMGGADLVDQAVRALGAR